MADAAQNALEGLRERTEQGHLKAGRTPPSQVPSPRSAGASRQVDDSIRSPYAVVTEDEKLLQQAGRFDDFTRTDTWRVLRITSEFIEGFDTLASVQKGVTVFGSARTGPDDPQYQNATEVARLLAEAGFAIITCRPRRDGSREPGARGAASHRLQHRAPVRAGGESVRGYTGELPLLLRA
jgi:hypothetical protein